LDEGDFMLTTKTTADLANKFGKSAKDSGSAAVQVAILTEKIKALGGHFEKHKKDHSGMRGLMKMIGTRKSLLKYLASKDEKAYQKLINDLGLRK
jgi:small subunit ribosomal protein S15